MVSILSLLSNGRSLIADRIVLSFPSRLARQFWWLLLATFVALCYSVLLLYNRHSSPFHSNTASHSLELDLSSTTPSDSYDFSNTPILLVSAFFPLPTSKHTPEEYARWLQLFLSQIKTPMVIYTTSAFEPTIIRLRGSLPVVINTEFTAPFDIPPLKNLGDKYAQQHKTLDPEKARHNPMLYATWNAKAWFVQDASSRYASNATEWFFWSDAGSLRQTHTFRDWPDVRRLEDVYEQVSKESRTSVQDLLFMQIWDAPPPSKRWKLWKQEDGTVDLGMMSEGSFFGGKLPAIKWWTSTFYALHNYYLAHDVFVGKDQNLFNSLMFLHSSRMITVWPRDPANRLALTDSRIEGAKVPARKCTWDVWYYFFYWLASDSERQLMRRHMIEEYDATSLLHRTWAWFQYDAWGLPPVGQCRLSRGWSFRDILKETVGRDE